MIVVFGSLNFDFLFTMDHLPTAGETALARRFQGAPGGKGANQAVAAARDGADVQMVGCVGRDVFGETLISSLQDAGVMCLVGRADVPTGCASVCVDGRGENAIAVAPGANLALRADAVPEHLLTPNSTVVLQMEVAVEENWRLLRRAKSAGARTMLNVAPAGLVPADALDLTDLLVVNRGELETLASIFGIALADYRVLARIFAERHALSCIVTLGNRGVYAASAHDALAIDAFPVEAIDTVGAGDTFCGVLAAALDRDTGLGDSLRRATVAAALACTRAGAQPSIPSAAETSATLERDRRALQSI
jgi:ribokinase